VNWIVWSSLTEVALIVNPEEAEEILPIIRNVKPPVCHLLSYAAPVSRKMNQFNDLKYYSVPALPERWTTPTWLSLEIGLLAGRLYFPYHEYDALCKFFDFKPIGSHLAKPNGDEPEIKAHSPTSTHGLEVGSSYSGPEGSLDKKVVSKRYNTEKPFTSKPILFLREWLAVRRGGNSFKHTPLGYLCDGRPLSSNHPFFRESSGIKAVD
jgi:hypothetical protein